MSNRLAQSNSPYLLQHADNPVDWYPWSEEALEKAKREDRPIFLSIGYAACHWCHVMAHESFEDEEIAHIMNEHFVNIKVDREERPDLDNIYMNAVVAMTGQGGWPMSVFLTSDGEPFFGGTYFPPVPRYNIPSFRDVLLNIARAWKDDRDRMMQIGKQLTSQLQKPHLMNSSDGNISEDSLDQASLALAQSYDWKHGGWGRAPKFPQPMAIEFLLRRAARGDKFALEIASHALNAMAKGGMYDVIGGGFARYSTDDDWLIPHFEKMLYDNALLARVYLYAYLLTKEKKFRHVCTETLDFIAREMTHPMGGFYSSLDADSEGEEGKYYVWTADEIRSGVGDPADVEFFLAAYNISEEGNFEGNNVLQQATEEDELAKRFSMSPNKVRERLGRLRGRLLEMRGKRVRPGTDDKILTFWNGLMLVSFAEAARYLGGTVYKEMAMRNADFLLSELHPKKRLLRSWRKGKAQHNAYLEDYAALILGLLSLYQTDPNPRWYSAANQLTEEMIKHFRDPEGGFFDTRSDHEPLLTRPKDLQDNATPSGNALAATTLLYLSAYSSRGDWRDMAEEMLQSITATAVRYPTSFSQWLCATSLAIHPIFEVAILGDPNHPNSQELIDTVWSEFRPNIVVAYSDILVPADAPPLLADRRLLDGLPTAYVCQNFFCSQPVTHPQDLLEQLKV